MSYNTRLLNPLTMPEYTLADVGSVMHTLNDSSVGFDDVPTNIVKQCIPQYIHPLTYIINISLCTGQFIDIVKISLVVAIFKSGSSTGVKNCRPISVPSFFQKCLKN